MSGETMLEILTGGEELIIGLDYLWNVFVPDARTGGDYFENQKCRLIDLTENKLTLFDYDDRARYSYNLKEVIDKSIRINPKPLNKQKETDPETYLLAQALHYLNRTEQMISAILDGQTLDKNMLEIHRNNIQTTMNQIKTKLG